MSTINPATTVKEKRWNKKFLESASSESHGEKKASIILISNYFLDKQESMLRFTQMLEEGYKKENIHTLTWRPVVFFASFTTSTVSGFGKWLGYLDKWILFPLILLWRVNKLAKRNVQFHICDHSNAPYLKYLPANRVVITCHDVLAIRGALGHKDAYCEASGLGKMLQKWILRNLSNAQRIACVSNQTLKQLKEIASPLNNSKREWTVVYNSFNAKFDPVETAEAKKIFKEKNINISSGYILHVGSSLPRKNRKLLLDMIHLLGDRYNGQICFAGEEMDEDLKGHAEKLSLINRVVSIVKPDHNTLKALYSECDAFIFPSFSEGFGWPVIEAQACGAPVIASNIEPMPEIGGNAAIYADPEDPAEFAIAFLHLRNSANRSQQIEQGFKNVLRFGFTKMIHSYLELHGVKHLQYNDA